METADIMDHQLVAKARALAERAHVDQCDKAGAPYVEHLQRVAAAVADNPVSPALAQAVAWLHDIIEDTAVGASDLRDAGMPAEVVHAVLALTHRPNEPRTDYYARVRRNYLAWVVKLADVADNSNPSRLALLDNHTRVRLEAKYAAARQALQPGAPTGHAGGRRGDLPAEVIASDVLAAAVVDSINRLGATFAASGLDDLAAKATGPDIAAMTNRELLELHDELSADMADRVDDRQKTSDFTDDVLARMRAVGRSLVDGATQVEQNPSTWLETARQIDDLVADALGRRIPATGWEGASPLEGLTGLGADLGSDPDMLNLPNVAPTRPSWMYPRVTYPTSGTNTLAFGQADMPAGDGTSRGSGTAPGWEHIRAEAAPSLSDLGVNAEDVKTVYLDSGKQGSYLVETWDGEDDDDQVYTTGLVRGRGLAGIVALLSWPERRIRVQQLPADLPVPESQSLPPQAAAGPTRSADLHAGDSHPEESTAAPGDDAAARNDDRGKSDA